jgi:hypothetical protein
MPWLAEHLHLRSAVSGERQPANPSPTSATAGLPENLKKLMVQSIKLPAPSLTPIFAASIL